MECTQCGEELFSRLERQRGTCARCYLAAWSPEKAEAMAKLVAPLGRRHRTGQAEDQPGAGGNPMGNDS